MAHTCPECGQVCYCNGDIDDCCFDFEENVINCVHWEECENEPDDDDILFCGVCGAYPCICEKEGKVI